MQNTKVSVIVPAYNSAKTLPLTIEALINQSYPADSLEIIVVDDGSTDDTREKVKAYPVKYIYQKNAGPAAARNSGWRASTAEMICFTDADCIPEKDWVRKLVQSYNAPAIGAVGGSYAIANKQNLLAACIYQEIVLRHLKMPRYPRALGSYNLSVKKKVLVETGGFNEAFQMASAEDNDLSYKIRKIGYLLAFDKDILVSHFHPENLKRYLKSQFWHGFWRVKLYKEHPNMSGGDDYSNILDYLQPVFSLLILFFLPFVFFVPIIRQFFLLLLTLEVLLQLPVGLPVIIMSSKLSCFFIIPVTFLRGFSRSLGMFYGVVKFIILGR